MEMLNCYPKESYNNKQRVSERWKNASRDSNGDSNAEWQISIANGKRLRQKWLRANGMIFVVDGIGNTYTIFNQINTY